MERNAYTRNRLANGNMVNSNTMYNVKTTRFDLTFLPRFLSLTLSPFLSSYLAEKLTSQSKFKSHYLIRDMFQVTTINTSLPLFLSHTLR